MTIASFSALRTEIASWLNRTDLTTAQLSMFVTMAESSFRNDLTVRESEQTATGTLVTDGFTAPTGYLYTRELVVDDNPLRWLPPEMYQMKVNNSTAGYYTNVGDDFSIIDGTGSDYVLTYVAGITALSADGDSNWLLANAPDVYLWAGCKYGSVFLRDPQGSAGYDALYKEAARTLNNTEMKAKFSGPLVVRAA